jgi:hypothetical protein
MRLYDAYADKACHVLAGGVFYLGARTFHVQWMSEHANVSAPAFPARNHAI